jgi:hypothetical protein
LDNEHTENPDDWRRPVITDAQIRSHLEKVFQNNFQQFRGGGIGVVNGTWGGQPITNLEGDIQGEEIWIGSQRAVAALMIRVGMKQEATQILEADFKNTWQGGFQGRTPEALSVDKQGEILFRFATYMRAGAIWSVYEALTQGTPAEKAVPPPADSGSNSGTVTGRGRILFGPDSPIEHMLRFLGAYYSDRARRAFQAAGIKTVGDLIQRTEEEVKALPELDFLTFSVIRSLLALENLFFKMTQSETRLTQTPPKPSEGTAMLRSRGALRAA